MSNRAKPSSTQDWLPEVGDVELHDHYHALGVLASRWNVAELQLQRICWFLMGAEVEVGRAVTNEMPNVARTNLMLTLAREVIKNDQVITFFETVAKLFNRNREHRNFIAHCRIMYPKNAAALKLAVFQQFKADGKFRHTMYLMPLEDLRGVADDVQAMNDFFVRFFDFLDAEKMPSELSSLDIPSLPDSLAQKLRSWQPSDLLEPETTRSKGF